MSFLAQLGMMMGIAAAYENNVSEQASKIEEKRRADHTCMTCQKHWNEEDEVYEVFLTGILLGYKCGACAKDCEIPIIEETPIKQGMFDFTMDDVFCTMKKRDHD